MKEILMMIIKMIDEGKISVDDGIRLIEAVRSTGYHRYENTKHMKAKMKSKMNDFVKDTEPKVKDAAKKIKEKSNDVADSISKGISNIKTSINEKNAAAAAEAESNNPLVDFDADVDFDAIYADDDAEITEQPDDENNEENI